MSSGAYHAGKTPSFLRLPLEIRRLIYAYLLPTVDIDPNNIRYGRRILRHDGKSGGGLLLVNRQIHNEIYNDWYSSTMFVIRIASNGGILFLNHFTVGPEHPMPSTLTAVKELYVDIDVSYPGEKSTEYDVSKISQLLSISRSLKQLYLGVNTSRVDEVFADMSDQKIHDKVLELHLHPLQRIRGLSEVPMGLTTRRKLSRYQISEPFLFQFNVASLGYSDDPGKVLVLPDLDELRTEDATSDKDSSIGDHSEVPRDMEGFGEVSDDEE